MLPFRTPLFGAGGGLDLAATPITTDRSFGGNRPFPAGVAPGDMAVAFLGTQTAEIVQSGGTSWTNIGATLIAKSRQLTEADLSSGYAASAECILAFYRGARSTALIASENVGQQSTRSVGGFTKATGHAGLVVLLFGAAPLNSEENGTPVAPSPFNLRRQGGYTTTSTTFVTAIWDRLTPLYVDGTDVTWLPSASNGNGFFLLELIA